MNLFSFMLAAALFFFFFTLTASAVHHHHAHHTDDAVSINCGSAEIFSASDGRRWIGDKQAKVSSSSIQIQMKGSSTAAPARGSINHSADQPQHKRARISRTRFRYEFHYLNPGPKFIRLHFNPVSYQGFKELKDFFTVEAGPFTLLSNFSPSLTAAGKGKSFVKEFCLSIEQNKPFNIVFYPDPSLQQGTFAFINGIEIISLPPHLSYFHGDVRVVGLTSLVHVDNYNNAALEIVHRQNLKARDDLVNMFDVKSILSKQKTNKISNVTWKFSVDVGFRYLIRIHFHEIELNNHVIFNIFLNEMIADTNNDLVRERNDNDFLQYKDYMLIIQGPKEEGRRHLSISLESSNEFVGGNGPVKGFEILKLNNPDNSLASPNLLPLAGYSTSQVLRYLLRACGGKFVTGTIVAIALGNIILHTLGRIWEANSEEEEEERQLTDRAQRLCRRFSLAEMISATKDFHHECIIGKGGFGKVYKGLIDGGKVTVAIKRLKYSSRQGAHEFWTEVETLSQLRHVNLVSLIGYCNEQEEMMLVYEYMTNGTLADHLYKLDIGDNNHFSSSISWKQLLNICIGAGRGLDYLHTGKRFIHRDVKASNILLDENFEAKVSDFGLAKPEERNKLQSHVSTIVKGTYGYVDPYYVKTRKLTRKSDTYSFGVVLLEVLSGRPALDPRVEDEKCNLTTWARESISKGEFEEIISCNLRDEISTDSLKEFVRVADNCLDDEPKKRPTMAQVVLQLEFALERQDSPNSLVPNHEVGIADVLPSIEKPILTAETMGTANTKKLKMPSTDEKRVTPPPIEQTGQKMVTAESQSWERDTTRTETQKLSRIFPWDALWKRRKLAFKKQTEPSMAGDQTTEVKVAEFGKQTTEVKVIEFDFQTIIFATGNFTKSLNRGLHHRFYKASLHGRRVVVVREKLHSDNERYMWKREISLLSKFGHPNLVKIIGYSIYGEELLLVCEFINGRNSLNAVSFGEQLSWTNRFKIIMGTARGLLHLHLNSTLRFFYRFTTPWNIFLDDEMTPKIALTLMHGFSIIYPRSSLDIMNEKFYTAPKSDQSDTSIKSETYVFGLIALELVTGYGHGFHWSRDLVTKVWEMWREGTFHELGGGFLEEEEVLRCIQVGLLCTQVRPEHRPEMSFVVEALQGDQDLEAEFNEAASRNTDRSQ